MKQIITVQKVRGYCDENGTAWLNAEDVARELGWTKTEIKGEREYTSIRWERLNGYLAEFGFDRKVGENDFISENMLYRLIWKSRDKKALAFQSLVADEILPTIRKTGSYSVEKPLMPLAASVHDIGQTAEQLQKLFALKRGIALSQAIDMACDKYSFNFNSLKKLLPPAKHETGYLNATQLAPKIGAKSPKFANEKLARLGLQYKAGHDWRLTEAGKAYGEEMPYTRNGRVAALTRKLLRKEMITLTLIDLFKEFHRNATQQEFPPSARVLYYTLLGEFNSARWIDSLVLSTRELTQMTGLPTTSVHRAKQFLTSKGIIKCRPFKNKTAFSLATEQSRNSNGTVTEQSRNTFASSNTRVREDLDVKTLDVSASAATRARAPVNYGIDRLIDRWEQSAALGKLDMLIVSKLNALLESYTCEEILAAMDKAILGNDSKHGVSYNYVEAILKGGERNVRVARRPATSRATGTDRRNVVELAQFARTDGKGAYDDDAPDCSWIYASGSDVAESDG